MSVRESATTMAVARPEDERLSVGNNIIYGLQHILAMFGGVIAVPTIIGGAAGLDATGKALLIASALFISGLATILQTVGVPYFGSQLPVVQGISFASVATLTAIIGKNGADGLRSAFGATIVAGIVALIIVPFFAKVIRFFPPVVTGTVITVIGLALTPSAAGWITGNRTITVNGQAQTNPAYASVNAILLAIITLVIILACSLIKRLARMAILIGLAIGWILAVPFGLAPAPKLAGTAIVGFPAPFNGGQWMTIFEIGAIVSMLIVLIVIMVETTADILAIGVVVGTEVDPKRLAAGLRADMLSCVVAPVFNTFPATAFAQNVGLVALSGIKSRWVVATGGIILTILGLSPWLSACLTALPLPVLGGAGIVLFGSVTASGIRSLSKVNFDGNNNLLIVAASITFGLFPKFVSDFWSKFPEAVRIVLDSPISMAAIMAFVLNLVFNVWGPGDKSHVHVTEAHGPARAVTDKDIADLDAQKAAGAIDGAADELKHQLDKAGDLLDGNPNKSE